MRKNISILSTSIVLLSLSFVLVISPLRATEPSQPRINKSSTEKRTETSQSLINLIDSCWKKMRARNAALEKVIKTYEDELRRLQGVRDDALQALENNRNQLSVDEKAATFADYLRRKTAIFREYQIAVATALRKRNADLARIEQQYNQDKCLALLEKMLIKMKANKAYKIASGDSDAIKKAFKKYDEEIHRWNKKYYGDPNQPTQQVPKAGSTSGNAVSTTTGTGASSTFCKLKLQQKKKEPVAVVKNCEKVVNATNDAANERILGILGRYRDGLGAAALVYTDALRALTGNALETILGGATAYREALEAIDNSDVPTETKSSQKNSEHEKLNALFNATLQQINEGIDQAIATFAQKEQQALEESTREPDNTQQPKDPSKDE